MAATATEAVQDATASSTTESKIEVEAPQPDTEDTPQQKDRDNDRGHNPRGRGKFQRRQGNRSNYESLPESNDAAEIRRQVEFYFSDSNLPVDAYLLKLTGGSLNKPVPLKTIHDFKRMRHFQPFSAVRDAVKASEILDLNSDDEITRKTPLDSRFTLDVSDNKKIAQEISLPRSVYAKGFGFELPTTQLDIETYFQPYGPVNSVRMRRHADGNFKGSVFVEFADEQLAKQFLELDIHPPFTPAGKESVKSSEKDTEQKTDSASVKGGLEVMSKEAYIESKGLDAEDEVDKPSSRRKQQNGSRGDKQTRGKGGRGRGGRGGRHDGIDRDDWKKRRDHDQGRRGKSDRRRDYRDVNLEDDEEDADEGAPPEDKASSNKRRRDDGDVDGESNKAQTNKKAKADEADASAE